MSKKFSKPSASTSFERMARLPSRVNWISLCGPFDALLDPGLLGRVGDVEELEADRAAIGATQDRQHLAHGRVFEAEHVVDEDFAVIVGFDETVGRRVQLLVVLLRLEAQRIEVGMQVAAHPEGADHHDCAHRIAGGALNLAIAGRRRRSGFGGLGADLVAERLFGRWPVAVERVDQIALRRLRPMRLFPRRAVGRLRNARRIVPKRREKVAPAGFERHRILFVFCLQSLDVSAVGAVEERSLQQRLIDVLACHEARSLIDFTCRSTDRPSSCRGGPARAKRGRRRIPTPRSCPRPRPCRPQ